MGKASKWFRSLLGSKNSKNSPSLGSQLSVSESAARDKNKSGSSNSNWGVVWNSVTGSNDSSLGGLSTGGGAAWSYENASSSSYAELDANKHAIAVAAATAAVAEAALAAAQAAAEVVRLTSAGTSASGTRTASSTSAYSSRDRRQQLAAIKIQSAFRAYLARRALRALKGLVKLQALVRGWIVRKQSADMLRRMQALARIQSRACASRVVSESPYSLVKSAQHHHADSPLLRKPENPRRSYNAKYERPDLKGGASKLNMNSIKVEGLQLGSSWLDRWMEECAWNDQFDASISLSRDDEKSVKILEIDTWKPTYDPRESDNTFQRSQFFQAWKENGQGVAAFDPLSGFTPKLEKPSPSTSSGDIPALRSLKFHPQAEKVLGRTAENSPCLHSTSSRPGSSSRRGPFTPTRSECSRSVFGDYLSHPSYMGSTESSLAKVRSQSAPRQRMQYERVGTNRKFLPGFWDLETTSERGSVAPANLRSKAYRSSPMNRVGTHVHNAAENFNATSKSRR